MTLQLSSVSATLYIFRCPIGQIPGVALLGHRAVCPCDSYCQIALGWIRSTFLSHSHAVSGRDAGTPGCSGHTHTPVKWGSKGEVTAWMWLCLLWHVQHLGTAWHTVVLPEGRSECDVKMWPGASLPSSVFLGAPYPKSARSAIGRMENNRTTQNATTQVNFREIVPS